MPNALYPTPLKPAPEGYEYTGELRSPVPGDLFVMANESNPNPPRRGRVGHKHTNNYFNIGQRWIIRKLPPQPDLTVKSRAANITIAVLGHELNVEQARLLFDNLDYELEKLGEH